MNKTIQTKSALCIVAVAILILAGYIVYKLCQFCSAHFNVPTQVTPPPAPPPAVTNVSEAAWFLQPPPQSQPKDTQSTSDSTNGPCDCGCSFTFTLAVINSEVVLTNGFVPTDETEAAFRQQLATLGLPNLSVSSHPADIQIIGGVVTVIGPDMITTVIERSGNMRDWTPVLTNSFPIAQKFVANMDGPCSNAFYRVVQP